MSSEASRKVFALAPGPHVVHREGDDDLMLFHAAYRAVVAPADKARARLGLGRAHLRLLFVLRREGGLTVGKLAERLGVSPQALQGVMRDLTGRGLVETLPNPDDRRQRRVALSAEGRALEKTLTASEVAMLQRMEARVGIEEMIAWRHAMRALVE